MSKMMKPEMEVVEFGRADVIATSGYGLATNSYYTTKGSELYQYDSSTYSTYNNSNFYVFQAGSSNSVVQSTVASETASGNNSNVYAWYDTNSSSWYTNNTYYDSNSESSYTPNGN